MIKIKNYILLCFLIVKKNIYIYINIENLNNNLSSRANCYHCKYYKCLLN